MYSFVSVLIVIAGAPDVPPPLPDAPNIFPLTINLRLTAFASAIPAGVPGELDPIVPSTKYIFLTFLSKLLFQLKESISKLRSVPDC